MSKAIISWITFAAFTLLAVISITGIWRAESNDWRACAVIFGLITSVLSHAAFEEALDATAVWRREKRR